MSNMMIERITPDEGRDRIRALLVSVGSTERELAERAARYDLTDREAAVWDEISELRWLIGQ